MNERTRTQKETLSALWLVLGLAFILSDNAAGWLFFILGLSGLSTIGDGWANEHPRLTTGLMVLMVLVLLLGSMAILLMR